MNPVPAVVAPEVVQAVSRRRPNREMAEGHVAFSRADNAPRTTGSGDIARSGAATLFQEAFASSTSRCRFLGLGRHRLPCSGSDCQHADEACFRLSMGDKPFLMLGVL